MNQIGNKICHNSSKKYEEIFTGFEFYTMVQSSAKTKRMSIKLQLGFQYMQTNPDQKMSMSIKSLEIFFWIKMYKKDFKMFTQCILMDTNMIYSALNI